MIGYWLTREELPGRVFAGTTPQEVGQTLSYEIETNEGLPADECGTISIEPCEITQEEIDALPEFQGW